mgnify:CR=1 FL=1
MTHVIRAARDSDLQPLYEMAKLTGGGFTNLPPDRAALRAKLERSAAAFARIDADNNGLLDKAELGAALKILGLDGPSDQLPPAEERALG